MCYDDGFDEYNDDPANYDDLGELNRNEALDYMNEGADFDYDDGDWDDDDAWDDEDDADLFDEEDIDADYDYDAGE